MTQRLDTALESRLIALGRLLIDQAAARIIVQPQQPAPGFWFGGGNVVQGPGDALYVAGRYRNSGDSRTGLGAGDRGLELAIFASHDAGETWTKELAFSKSELNVDDRQVLSIEGCALHWTDEGVELFVSTEKTNIGYPTGLEDYLKPGTGVWTIDRVVAPDLSALKDAKPATILSSDEPQFLHVKDPFVYEREDGALMLFYCTHPFSWSSSNTAYAIRGRDASKFSAPDLTFFPRGTTWDVAMTRGTAVLRVPRLGPFARRNVSLIFYDGGECLRNLEEHSAAVVRPRGYSCEELGGLAYVVDDDFTDVHRLSISHPMFVSDYGTGCSRYVDVCVTDEYTIATWQQSQRDASQPLVFNRVPRAQIEATLTE